MNREHVVLVFLILFITIHTLATTPSARSVPNSSSESPGVEWNKTYGGGSATSIQQASDGGYVFADGWLVDTDSSGNMRWNKTYDGSARSVEQTADGGYIIGGSIPQKDYDYLSSARAYGR